MCPGKVERSYASDWLEVHQRSERNRSNEMIKNTTLRAFVGEPTVCLLHVSESLSTVQATFRKKLS